MNDVAEAFDQWRWISPDATVTTTDDWTLVLNPPHFAERLELVRIDPEAEPSVVMEEVLEASRETEAEQLVVWLRMDTPGEYAALLAAEGGLPHESLDLLARDLQGDIPAVSPGADLRWCGTWRPLATPRRSR